MARQHFCGASVAFVLLLWICVAVAQDPFLSFDTAVAIGDKVNVTWDLSSISGSVNLWVQELSPNASEDEVPLDYMNTKGFYSWTPTTTLDPGKYFYELQSASIKQDVYKSNPFVLVCSGCPTPTASTYYNSATAVNTSRPSLSPGAAAGISVAATLALVALLGWAWYFYRRSREKSALKRLAVGINPQPGNQSNQPRPRSKFSLSHPRPSKASTVPGRGNPQSAPPLPQMQMLYNLSEPSILSEAHLAEHQRQLARQNQQRPAPGSSPRTRRPRSTPSSARNQRPPTAPPPQVPPLPQTEVVAPTARSLPPRSRGRGAEAITGNSGFPASQHFHIFPHDEKLPGPFEGVGSTSSPANDDDTSTLDGFGSRLNSPTSPRESSSHHQKPGSPKSTESGKFLVERKRVGSLDIRGAV